MDEDFGVSYKGMWKRCLAAQEQRFGKVPEVPDRLFRSAGKNEVGATIEGEGFGKRLIIRVLHCHDGAAGKWRAVADLLELPAGDRRLLSTERKRSSNMDQPFQSNEVVGVLRTKLQRSDGSDEVPPLELREDLPERSKRCRKGRMLW